MSKGFTQYFYSAILLNVMEIIVVVVPPGGGEAEYSLPFEVPEAPNEGDYISVKRPQTDGFEHFIVRRRRWMMEFPEAPPVETEDDYTVGETEKLYIEAEIAEGPVPSEGHERVLSRYEDAKEHEQSAY